MAPVTESEQTKPAILDRDLLSSESNDSSADLQDIAPPKASVTLPQEPPKEKKGRSADAAEKIVFQRGWPVPSSISANPEEARACIPLPAFDELLLEKARVIAGRFPFGEAEYRRAKQV